MDHAYPAVISLNNIHHSSFRLDEIQVLAFDFHKNEKSIALEVDYHSQTYNDESMDRIVSGEADSPMAGRLRRHRAG
jgi:hypothetical protein